MAGRDRHLQERNGRYYARVVVPQTLRPFLDNRTELRTPLGADRRAAVKALALAVADIQKQIDAAKRVTSGLEKPRPPPAAMSDEQIALESYRHRLEQDESLRRASLLYGGSPIDDGAVAELRTAVSGQASDDLLEELVGHRIQWFQEQGSTDAKFGSSRWRDLARMLCRSELEALERVFERDEGDFSGRLRDPALVRAETEHTDRVAHPEPEPVSLLALFDDYVAAKKLVDRGEGAARRWAPVFRDLCKFLGHDDARCLTKQDLMKWRSELNRTLSPKTVRDVWLASIRTVLNWAVREDRLSENVAKDVRQELPKRNATREKGFTDAEALVILSAASNYTRRDREHEETASAKKWVPWLCAFTGARVTELTQLRKQDIRKEGGLWVLRITPDAGTVKAGGFRDVPLHPQLVERGFAAFVEAAPAGPLFHRARGRSSALVAARTVSGRISTWLGTLGIIPEGVSPSHGWRHRFKTVGREIGSSDRVLDAICGHAGRSAGDAYGDVSLAAKARVIEAFPTYEIRPTES